jgi:hypothetical protein
MYWVLSIVLFWLTTCTVSEQICLHCQALLVDPGEVRSLSCKMEIEQVMKLCAFYQNELIGVIPLCYVTVVHFCVATVRGNCGSAS